jgi:hypothetical protein
MQPEELKNIFNLLNSSTLPEKVPIVFPKLPVVPDEHCIRTNPDIAQGFV